MISTIQKIDIAILDFIQNNLHFSILDSIMPIVSWTGNIGLIWILIALIFIFSKNHKNIGFVMILSLIFCLVIGNVTLKNIFARARPFYLNSEIKLLISRPTDFSFPSGHTMSSFAASTVILLFNKSWGKWTVFLASLIAFSRLYLYVHYPSDVFFGMLIGILIGFISVKLFKQSKYNL